MKCPICEREIRSSENEKLHCVWCGFDDIRTEFINDSERQFWMTYVVKPCKYAYRLNNTLLLDVAKLRKEIIKLSSEKITHSETTGLFTAPPQAKVSMREGWNYDDPISHPNYAEGICWGMGFSVSDIKIQMKSSSSATVSFLAKKTSDKSGKNSTEYFLIRYRVKDQDGVIVLNEEKRIEGLQVGDVTRAKIELTGIAPNRYSIDFVSH